MIAISLFAVFFNTVLARKLPLIEGIILVVHVCAFIGIVVTLWVLAPRSDAASVFTGFTDAGWHSLGGSALMGITAGILPLIGADAAVHMSEGRVRKNLLFGSRDVRTFTAHVPTFQGPSTQSRH